MSSVWNNDDLIGLIVDHLADNDLKSCSTVHPSLYYRWLSRRYARVNIEQRCKSTKALLRNIANEDMKIAPFVCELRITPWPVNPTAKSPKSHTEAIVRQIALVVDPAYTKKKLQVKLQKKLRKDSERITQALAAMKGVAVFEINWDETQKYHLPLFHAVLTPLLRPAPEFASWKDLRRFSVKLPPKLLSCLAGINFTQLEDFTYTFATGDMSAQDIVHAHNGFVVFLHNTCHTLRRLSISSNASCLNLDTSWLYEMLSSPLCGRFSQLESISVSFPSDGQHLSEPEHLVRFLSKEPTIKDLEIHTTRSAPRSFAGKPGCDDVIHRILCGIRADERDPRAVKMPSYRLRKLNVPFPAHTPFDTLLDVLRTHASRLEDLSISCHAFRMDDIRAIIRVLSLGGLPILETLGVRLRHTPQSILTDLAGTLTSLKVLQLDFSAAGETAARDYITRLGAHIIHRRELLSQWPLQKLLIGNKPFAMHVPLAEPLRVTMPHLSVLPLRLGD